MLPMHIAVYLLTAMLKVACGWCCVVVLLDTILPFTGGRFIQRSCCGFIIHASHRSRFDDLFCDNCDHISQNKVPWTSVVIYDGTH